MEELNFCLSARFRFNFSTSFLSRNRRVHGHRGIRSTVYMTTNRTLGRQISSFSPASSQSSSSFWPFFFYLFRNLPVWLSLSYLLIPPTPIYSNNQQPPKPLCIPPASHNNRFPGNQLHRRRKNPRIFVHTCVGPLFPGFIFFHIRRT